ncbi:MAG: Nif3-like dinuclear metal center hexameric protein [Candidatus Latescibacteria bacterium]|nr:Nif3-like dinuclear metal center hexameric protein [Candidatus Latescibacterota bacterium]NIM66435.1 Nif3-like dinuclear metal center hexameric protein [Candidatus Latescibacterota bacterium]NIO02915.1 Nif3-like dinuclear metal center hexameric protein [Candidatus Latescibacterota bacterium]NIO30050.1 Nif3-like dinuclear metal center hexameric protein [Candidatus Latescibacterota bacterium]NIO57665.1 Nif3-like dinuclear metal center hexameric protein [Candidatus Latescibacterota bacterium]
MAKEKSVSRDRLIRYLNEYLSVTSITDDSVNGLQVEGSARISRASFAVDACLKTIRAAARNRANILIVHHGLFWSGTHQRIIGVMRERILALLANGISLYASHLPLDGHDVVGNNVELSRILGFENLGKFGSYKGTKIGVIARPEKVLRREELVKRLEKKLEAQVEMLPFGPRGVKKVGIVSGDAGFLATNAKEEGCDTLITGETSHVVYHFAKEARVNVIYAGHYASETVGLKALARHIRERFPIVCKFISAPTGY